MLADLLKALAEAGSKKREGKSIPEPGACRCGSDDC